MKLNNFQGDQTDISAKKEAQVAAGARSAHEVCELQEIIQNLVIRFCKHSYNCNNMILTSPVAMQQ